MRNEARSMPVMAISPAHPLLAEYGWNAYMNSLTAALALSIIADVRV